MRMSDKVALVASYSVFVPKAKGMYTHVHCKCQATSCTAAYQLLIVPYCLSRAQAAAVSFDDTIMGKLHTRSSYELYCKDRKGNFA